MSASTAANMIMTSLNAVSSDRGKQWNGVNNTDHAVIVI